MIEGDAQLVYIVCLLKVQGRKIFFFISQGRFFFKVLKYYNDIIDGDTCNT